jgi:hypothetical protein
MEDITKLDLQSGRIVGEDGKVYNKVSLMQAAGSDAEPIDDKVYDIERYPARSGRLIGEDGKVYNEVDLLKSIVGADSYSKAESDEKFALNSALVDNAAKNLLLLTLEGIKKASESDDGTWHDNVYTENGINFAIATDDVERVISITVSQTAGAATGSLSLVPSTIDPETLDIIYDPTYSAGNYIFSVGGSLPDGVDLVVSYEGTSGSMMQYVHDEAAITLVEGSGCLVEIYVRSITESEEPVIFDDFVIHPMFRRAGTSASFETGYMTQKQLDAAVRELQKSGGGETSSYSETVLYDGSDGGTTATVGELTLPQSATNFDCFVCLFGKADGSSHVNKAIRIEPNLVVDNGWQADYGPIGWYISNGGLTFGWNNGNQMYPRKIIGINYGGDK